MTKEYRKQLADEYKENPIHPEYKKYYDEFYKEAEVVEEPVKPKGKGKK